MNSSINWGFYIRENSLNLLVKAKNTIIFFKPPEFKEYYGIFHCGSLRKTVETSPASFPVVHDVLGCDVTRQACREKLAEALSRSVPSLLWSLG